MSRILALADTQLGVQTVVLADQRDVLDRIVQVALERKVDAVLHGGDVFEGPVVTPAQMRCFVDAMAPLHKTGIPLLVIRGNGRHDMAVREVHALDILREVDGIQVSDSPAVCILDGKVAVCTLPWVHPGKLMASMNGSLTHEEADLTTAEMLVRIAQHLYGQTKHLFPIPAPIGSHGPLELPTVLLAHWAISGSALPTGLPVDEMREPILPWADLDAIGYDAIIGAHIHQAQTISNPELDRTLGIVVGSPQQLNHGEHGDHGCWILDLDGGYAEFVPIKSRRFLTLDLDPEDLGGDSYNVYGADGLEPVLEGDIVRVRYRGTESQAQFVDHESLRRSVIAAGASRVTIEPTIIRKDRARAQQISEQLSPIDALATYCDANEIEAERAVDMLARLKKWSEE